MRQNTNQHKLYYELDKSYSNNNFEYQSNNTKFELDLELSNSYRQVKNTTEVPWRWICSIIVEFPEQVVSICGDKPANMVFGSGVLITFGHVLTSAHLLVGLKCIGNKVITVTPKKITVIPGRDDERNPSPFREFNVEKYNVPRMYYSNVGNERGLPFDYALITLKKKFGKHAGNKKYLKLGGEKLSWWSRTHHSYIKEVTTSFRQHLSARKVNVAGYPYKEDSNYTDHSRPAGLMYSDFEMVIDSFPKLNNAVVPMLSYDATTGKSMSGGPVWIYNDSNRRRYLVAIHRGKNAFGSYADAVLITHNLIKQLVSWGVKREWMTVV